MKKKVLIMLLAVTMSTTVGIPVCAADFTSGAESVAEFSESFVDSEDVSENTADTGTVSEEADAEEEAEEAEESAAEQEETDDAAVSGELEASEEADAEAFAAEEVAEEDITDEEDATPEFNDGQKDVLTDSAELPSASKKYPSMKKQSGYVYTTTVKNVTDNDYVKFVPGKTGIYVFRMDITSFNPYSHRNETYTNSVYNVYNSSFKTINAADTRAAGYTSFKMEKGKTYYLGCTEGSKIVFSGEILTDIVSIKPVGFKDTSLYTPIDFSRTGGVGSRYDAADRWKGKFKLTYSDGKTETISSHEVNKYGVGINIYVVYKGKKSSPVAGKYDVYFSFEGSKAKYIKKNVSVKKLSSMPTLNGSGTKTFATGGRTSYARFKTGKNTKYRIKFTFPNYDLGNVPVFIKQEKNGELEGAGRVMNGGTCTLKANSVYYFQVRLFSSLGENPTMTLKVTPVN